MGKANAKIPPCWQRCGDRRGRRGLVTGLIMVLTIDDTSRYESPHSSLAWLGWAKSNGGGVAVAGRF